MKKNLINNIDLFLAKIFFKSFNSLRYCLFDFVLDKKFLKKNSNQNEKIKSFHEKGYVKLKTIDHKYLEPIKNIFDSKINNKEEEYVQKPSIDMDQKKNLKKLINENFNEIFSELKKYYNSDIFVTNVELKKIYHIKEEDQNEEKFNNFFHIDSYLKTHFKIFVNISDISLENGPTEIFDINDTKEIRSNNSFNIQRGKLSINNKLKPFINIGDSGEVLLCNTSKCLHRASNPKQGNSRENLIITMVAFKQNLDLDNYFYFEEIDEESIWTQKNVITKYLAKPKRYKEVIKLVKKYI